MAQLTLSIMYTNDLAIEALRLALGQFEQMHKVRVNLQVLAWDTAWSDLVKVAIYKTGPDVSEVGTTWTESFASLRALRQFEQEEIEAVGGPSVFLPSIWPRTSFSTDGSVWGIPWSADTRIIYYRRDLLQQAGVDEASAFSSPAQFYATLDRLQAGDIPVPLAIPTVQQQINLHLLASWVWVNGGQFMSPNRKRVLFHTGEALQGFEDYFNLRRYLAPEIHYLDDSVIDSRFRYGNVAVVMTGQWLQNTIRAGDAAPEVAENFGTAVVPSVPFVGGSNLAVWRHSRKPGVAVKLVQYLTSVKVQTQVIGKNGMLPVRREALNAPPFTTDPHYQVIGQSLQQGRGFLPANKWGLVEDKLNTVVGKIWAELLDNPEARVGDSVSRHIEPLAKELNHIL